MPEKPQARLIRTWQDAEDYAAEYVRWLGWPDATATRRGGDEGIDVLGGNDGNIVVAQVKMEVNPIESRVIRELRGSGAVLGAKHHLMFALAGYKAPALDWATRAGVALFEFAYDGSVDASNLLGTELIGKASAPISKQVRHRKTPQSKTVEGALTPAAHPAPKGAVGTLQPVDLKLLSAVERWERPNRAQLSAPSLFNGLPAGDLSRMAKVDGDLTIKAFPAIRKYLDVGQTMRSQDAGVWFFAVTGIKHSGVQALRAWGIKVQDWRPL